MNQVARTFLLVGLVVTILLAAHFLPTFILGDNELRRVNILSELLPEAYVGHEGVGIPQVPEIPVLPEVVSDSTSVSDSINEIDEPAVVPQGVTMIADYGQGESGGMRHFYSQLARVKSLNRPVRIAYFGDSFIEGDILSCDLREQLQTHFGGNGVGWVDCASQVYGFRQTVRHSFNGLQEYEVVQKPFNIQVQSIAQRYFIVEGNQAWFQFQGSTSRQHLSEWQKATFFFRTQGSFSLATRINADTTICEQVQGDGQLQVLTQRDPSMKKIGYTVSDVPQGTYLYGVALESNQGVIVDNFSMRGSSGVTLGSIPASVLQEFAVYRPYDLIIVHFGLNVASEKSQAGNYKAYTKQMGQVISHLRQAYPEASVLVVSMSDRDQRTSAGIHTMIGVESLVAYQQIMSAHQQVAFFNLFEAMGGRESMKTLVDNGLANKDYTHLTFAGGRRLGTYLVESILVGYENYKKQQP